MKQNKFHQLLLLVIGSLLLANGALAQSSDTSAYSRFQFAQTYLGAELYYIPGLGHSYYLDPEIGQKTAFDLESRIFPRFTIGGPHFWGHAEFFVNVSPFGSWSTDNDRNEATFSPGTETGFRLYPWSIYQHPIAPFAGFSWSAASYKQSTDSGSDLSLERSTTYFQAGLSWQAQSSLIQIGIQYQPNHSFSYPLSRTQYSDVELSPWHSWISYKYLFDTTEGSQHDRESPPDNRSGRNAFSVAGGPSGAFGLTPSDYNSAIRPYLNNPVPSALSPDISLGYYLFNLDATIRISYRRIVHNLKKVLMCNSGLSGMRSVWSSSSSGATITDLSLLQDFSPDANS